MNKIISKTGISMLFASSVLMNAYGQQSGQLTSDKGFKGKIGRTVAESQEYHPEKKKDPAGAPNVVVFLIDDAGYGTSSAFGGLIQTPVLDSLANNGLRYTNFHSTGVCSPT